MSDSHEQVDLVGRVLAALRRIGAFWLHRPYYQQVLFVLAILLLKNAFDIELRNIQEAYLPGVQEFPRAVGYFSGSYGQVVIAAALGVTTTTQWVLLHVLLIITALMVAFWLIGRTGAAMRSFLILALAAATATSSLFLSIGKYDVITYLGAVILALSRSLPAATFGALLMASGNPEQSIVASIALLVLSFASEFRDIRNRALAAILVTTLTWLSVQLWFKVSDMNVSRISLVPEYLAESLARVLATPGMAVWSWLGVGWLVVATVAIAAKVNSRKWLLLSLVVIPAAVTVVTADGARVFAMVGLPSYLVASVWWSRLLMTSSRRQQAVTGGFLLCLTLLPTGVVTSGWLYQQLFGLLARF